MRKTYYLSTPHLARSRTPSDLNKCVRAIALVYAKMRERERERERERGRERERERRAIHVLLIHCIFVVGFFLYFTYSIRILHSLQKRTASAVTRIH